MQLKSTNDYIPKTCTWEMTLRCNLNCGHCGSRAGRPRLGEMSGETMLRVMGELAALGCQKVTLSGGEPTMSPHWEALVAEGTRLGVRVNMITNGLLADRDLIGRAKEVGLRGLGVSLDGFEEAHDQIRGRRGMYRRVIELLDDCKAVGLPVGVITTIWKGNLDDLEAMAELLSGRVYVWQVQIGEAMGNLKDRGADQIDPRDLLKLLPTLARIAQSGKVPIRVADNIGYYGRFEPKIRGRRPATPSYWSGCKAGCRHLGIEADGGVKGCLSLQATKATEGNLQEASLSDIWYREGAFSYNRAFSLDDLSGFCRSCGYAEVCRGGCFSARTCEGGVDNPFCYYRVAALSKGRVRRAVAQAIAPAALATLVGLGLGCPTEDLYGVPPDGDGDADADNADAYGMPDGDADGDSDGDADIDNGDLYGIFDADPDNVDFYGMPDGDADIDGDADADVYGMDADNADYYGLPDADADADADNADYYGLPDADADADADNADWYGLPDADPDAEVGGDLYGIPDDADL